MSSRPESSINKNNLVTNGFGSFDLTSAWNLPTAHDHHPMHHNHPNQFGVEVAELVPGFLAAGRIHLSILLPQFEEEFNLPSCS